jgi:hypothetical protein
MRQAEQAAVDTLRDEAAQVARAAADAACNLVVQDEASAVMANEYLQHIARGKKYLTTKQAELTAPWRRIADAIRGRLADVILELERGDRAVRASLDRYMAEADRKAKVEHERQQAEARKQAEGFSSLGDDAPPPMQVPPPEPVREVRGPSGSVHRTKVLEVELVTPMDAPPEWLELNTKLARAEWNAAIKRGDVNPEGQVWNGVRFSYRTTVSR